MQEDSLAGAESCPVLVGQRVQCSNFTVREMWSALVPRDLQHGLWVPDELLLSETCKGLLCGLLGIRQKVLDTTNLIFANNRTLPLPDPS